MFQSYKDFAKLFQNKTSTAKSDMFLVKIDDKVSFLCDEERVWRFYNNSIKTFYKDV